MGGASEVLYVAQRDVKGKPSIVFAIAEGDGLMYAAASATDPTAEKLELWADAARLGRVLAGGASAKKIEVDKLSVEDHEKVLADLLSSGKSPEALLQAATTGGGDEERPSALEVELVGPVASSGGYGGATEAAVVADVAANAEDHLDEMLPGRDFLACCDVKGTELTFGAWYHKRGSGRGGIDSYDVCPDVYLALPAAEQASFVRIDSVQDVITHMGPPPKVEELDAGGDDDTAEQCDAASLEAAEAAAKHIDVAKNEISAMLQKMKQVTADEVLLSLLQKHSDSCPPFEAVRAAIVRLAKSESGLHYERGEGDSGTCVLRRLCVTYAP